MLKFVRHILRAEKGATAVEYGLIVSLIVIAILTALGNFASVTNDMLSTVSSRVSQSNN